MKSSRASDFLPWLLVGLSAVIMGVAVGVYSSDASATDTAFASEGTPTLMDAGEAEAAERATAPQPHPAQL